MKTLIVCATQKSDPKETLLYQSLKPLKEKCSNFEAEFYTSNKEGLSKIYNSAMRLGMHDCHLFVHDDVYIDDAFIFDKIEDGFASYDIIGVAGASSPKIKAPALWHLMTEKFNWHGAAGHFLSKSEIGITSFGSMPAKVDILDGVLLAVNTKKALVDTAWEFNENYTFHHYDIASCLDAGKKGLRCGVLPIHIVHQSPGLRNINDPVFAASQTQFLKEYGS